MNASDLKYEVEKAGREPHFFTRDTMKFFGDRMSNYGVREAEIVTNYDGSGNWVGKEGIRLKVWELYRRRAVKHGLKSSAYFDQKTFAQVFAAKLD